MTTTPIAGWAVAQRKPPSERVPGKAAWRLVTGFEGLSLKSYPDPASPLAKQLALPLDKRVANWEELPGDPWTIAYGHTGNDIGPNMSCTLAQADAWLTEDLNEAAGIVREQVTVPLTAGEFDALCSLAFNLGYIPKSLKACLNGGVTDKGVEMAAGSYGSALAQLPRNCRAAGTPLRGLLRRRLAEACVYSDLPWESACSENIVKLEHTNGVIDPYLTTSLEETLQRARQDVPILRPDVSDVIKAPWPQANDELVLTDKDKVPSQTAPTAKPDPGTAPAKATQPEPVQLPAQNTGKSAPMSPGGSLDPLPPTPPKAPPVSTLPPPKLPDPPVPIGQQTSAVDATRKGEEWSHNAKSMIFSRRFWGLFLVLIGRLWMLKTGSNAVLGTVSDPLVMEMFSGFMVMIIGEIVQHWGERKATRPLK